MIFYFYTHNFRNKHDFVLNRKLKMRNEIASIRFMAVNTIFFGGFVIINVLARKVLSFNNFLNLVQWLDSVYVCCFFFYIIHIFYLILQLIQWHSIALAIMLKYWRLFLMSHNIIVINKTNEKFLYFEQLNVCSLKKIYVLNSKPCFSYQLINERKIFFLNFFLCV